VLRFKYVHDIPSTPYSPLQDSQKEAAAVERVKYGYHKAFTILDPGRVLHCPTNVCDGMRLRYVYQEVKYAIQRFQALKNEVPWCVVVLEVRLYVNGLPCRMACSGPALVFGMVCGVRKKKKGPGEPDIYTRKQIFTPSYQYTAIDVNPRR